MATLLALVCTMDLSTAVVPDGRDSDVPGNVKFFKRELVKMSLMHALRHAAVTGRGR